MSEPENRQLEETLIEMAYRWADIESGLGGWFRTDQKTKERERVGQELFAAVTEAFRVEANVDESMTGFGGWESRFVYVLLFDVETKDAREAAQTVRSESRFLESVIKKQSGGQSRSVEVRVTSAGAPAEGEICARPWEPKPKKHLDVSEIPERKPTGSVPYIEKDGYWLTPIEVPFYDALRETAAIFAVQPWVQGVDRRYRPDFMVFYDRGVVIVELDGHETHKSREDRTRDAKRARWFQERGIQVLRWTGSEIHANPQECVRQLLEILRGGKSRF